MRIASNNPYLLTIKQYLMEIALNNTELFQNIIFANQVICMNIEEGINCMNIEEKIVVTKHIRQERKGRVRLLTYFHHFHHTPQK